MVEGPRQVRPVAGKNGRRTMNDADSIPNVVVRISREALWAPLAVVLLHSLAGGWLGHEPYVDPVMHFAGGVAAAFFFWRSAECCQRYLGNLSVIGLALLAFGLATFAAVAWESVEFLRDTYRGTSMQRGLANTMRDLFLGVSGAVLFVGMNTQIKLRSRSVADE